MIQNAKARSADIMVAKGFLLPILSSLLSGALIYAQAAATWLVEVGGWIAASLLPYYRRYAAKGGR